MKRLTWTLLTLFPALALRAQTGEAAVYDFPAYGWTLAIVLLAGVIVVYAFYALFRLARHLDAELQVARQKLAGTWVEPEPEAPPVEAAEAAMAEEPSAIATFFGRPKVAIEDEDTITLDHNYDGIRELDNDLPPWWTALFYVTIAFGVVYLAHYHVLRTGPSSAEKYETAMAKAEEAKLARQAGGTELNASTVTLLTDASSLSAGEAIFMQNCMTCHGPQGQGLAGAGPNFTDEYWIHGGAIGDLYTTIRYGVPSKGMIAWKDQLRPVQIQQVASFILSLQGTDPPNALPPQGERYVPEEAPSPEGETPAATDEQQPEAAATASL